ncbi:TIGR03663 family protein [bacterium]|nr:TIGR03663 family protein [bacterium]
MLALALRVQHLENRPMHTDEAVQGMKFLHLLEGTYQYDPAEYHGPALNYFTLPVTWITGRSRPGDVSETMLRIVPAIFGTLIILLIPGLHPSLSRPHVLWAGILIALSSVFSYYSRYYIHETLFVFFTLGLIVCLYRYLLYKKVLMLAAAGAFTGLMHATKETAVISWTAISAAFLLTAVRNRRSLNFHRIRSAHWLTGLLAAVLVSAFFYSRAFTDMAGILDSWSSWHFYLLRGTGGSVHLHPPAFYARRLLWFHQSSGGPVFSELLILLLALPGFIFAFRPKSSEKFVFFWASYTLFLTLVYSLIPYKTPWLALNFWLGWIIMAGMGISFILERLHADKYRIIGTGLLGLGLLHLGLQNFLVNDPYAADPANPWVYAHPGTGIAQIETALDHVTASHPMHKNLDIQIAVPGHEYWPLPWMLRQYQGISWRDHVSPDMHPASIIVIASCMKNDLVKILYEDPPPGQRYLYIPLFDTDIELRPGVPVSGYVRKDVWD